MRLTDQHRNAMEAAGVEAHRQELLVRQQLQEVSTNGGAAEAIRESLDYHA